MGHHSHKSLNTQLKFIFSKFNLRNISKISILRPGKIVCKLLCNTSKHVRNNIFFELAVTGWSKCGKGTFWFLNLNCRLKKKSVYKELSWKSSCKLCQFTCCNTYAVIPCSTSYTTPPGGRGGQEPGVLVPTFLFFDSWGLFTLNISMGKKLWVGGHVGVTKVEQSIIFSALFSEKLELRTVYKW